MNLSSIQNSGIYQAQGGQRAQAAQAPAPEEAGEKRIVPEERAFDRYVPEDSAETTTCNTDRVDREIEQLKQEEEQLEEQLRSASSEQTQALEQELAQIERELAQKDNNAYRRQHAVFS